ncbi:MAG: hypothetical protein LBT26_05650 [Clostridiales Family XIII bacterium]|jgi:hypothetical protein|nr:hypothetical protein [Clostridiales Family XIII bacterium]
MLLLCIVILLVGFAFPMYLMGFHIIYLLNPATLVTVLLAILFVLAATSGFALFIRCIKASLFRKYRIADEDKARGVEIFRLLARSMVFAAVFLVLCRAVVMLGYLDESAFLGHSFSAMMSGVVLSMIPLALFEAVAWLLRTREKMPASERA